MKKFLKHLFKPQKSAALPETAEEVIEQSDIATVEDSAFNGDLNAVVVSDLGNVRKNNEDTGLFVRLADEGVRRLKGYLLLVADGMGGHLAGEVASQMAAEIVNREYFQSRDTVEKSLLRAFQMANQQIFAESRQHERFRGMGTTCTVLIVHQQQLYFAHVGDSRAYMLKQGQFIQLTEDHTYVRELLRMGEINEKEATTHPDRNVLTQAMGTKTEVKVDIGRCVLPFDLGDKLLLCSDGLYEYCREEDFIRIMSQLNLADAADELVQLAKLRGGHDNITVVMAEWGGGSPVALPKETRDIDLPFTRDIELL